MMDFDAQLEESQDGMMKLMRWFALALALLVFGVGGWAFAARIESAVVASGVFTVRSSAQAVQHLEGGVIGAILVQENQLVQEGDVVIRLDGASATAELAIHERRRVDLLAERARLTAERDGLVRAAPPPDLDLSPELATSLRAAMTLQQTLLTSRLSARRSQRSQLLQRLEQTANEISGLERLRRARQAESVRVEEELEALSYLDAKRLIAKSRLRAVQREAARIEGDIGDIDARIASARSRAVETELRIQEMERSARTEVIDTLTRVEADLSATEEKRAAALDRRERLEIRAPRTGFVHELTAHTVGGVAGAGETLMSIIPQDEPLIIAARVAVTDIDQVFLEQPATVKISAFSQRTSPELSAEVIGVSPDMSEDARTGERYYSVRIALLEGETDKLGAERLKPGLPAEIFLLGASRQVISYLTQPLADQVDRAFREQ